MNIQRVIKVKAEVGSEEEKQLLLDTLREYTLAYNELAKIGWDAHNYNPNFLHSQSYYPLKERFDLNSQLLISARNRAAESLKAVFHNGHKKSCPVSTMLPIRYDKRSGTIWLDRKEVSLSTLRGRIRLPIAIADYYGDYLNWEVRSSELHYKKGEFFLYIVIQKDIAPPELKEPINVVGVDLGLNRTAVTSENQFYNGHVKGVKLRYHRLRRALQKKGTPSAKRHLKKLSSKEKRFIRDVNHCIAKQIVENTSEGSVIVFEKLDHIRDSAKAKGKKGRRRLHQWSFAQLIDFVRYKAEEKGIKVDFVSARYTSQKCSRCGHIQKANRQKQSVFKCKKCGYELNADLNAARNIRSNYLSQIGRPDLAGLPRQPAYRSLARELQAHRFNGE